MCGKSHPCFDIDISSLERELWSHPDDSDKLSFHPSCLKISGEMPLVVLEKLCLLFFPRRFPRSLVVAVVQEALQSCFSICIPGIYKMCVFTSEKCWSNRRLLKLSWITYRCRECGLQMSVSSEVVLQVCSMHHKHYLVFCGVLLILWKQ